MGGSSGTQRARGVQGLLAFYLGSDQAPRDHSKHRDGAVLLSEDVLELCENVATGRSCFSSISMTETMVTHCSGLKCGALTIFTAWYPLSIGFILSGCAASIAT
jgi:hypothetical protein